jgi:hypothetical protein
VLINFKSKAHIKLSAEWLECTGTTKYSLLDFCKLFCLNVPEQLYHKERDLKNISDERCMQHAVLEVHQSVICYVFALPAQLSKSFIL